MSVVLQQNIPFSLLHSWNGSPNMSLVVGSAKIPCDRKQLASAAPNLYEIIRSQELRLPDGLHVKAVQTLVEFITGGKMDVSVQSAPSLLECADVLGMERAKEACVRCLSQSISPSNCIQLKKLAMEYSTSQLDAQCDKFIDSCFTELLSQEEFLNLPRIQVNVDVSTQLFEFCTDANMADSVLPKVMTKLHELSTNECGQTTHLDEGVVRLVLMPDFSLSSFADSAKMTSQNSPERPLLIKKLKNIQPSPARRLILGDSMEADLKDKEDSEVEGMTRSWKTIAVAKISEVCFVSLMEIRGSSLRVLNVTLVASDVEDKQFPRSPTTGLPATSGSALMAQMNMARGGFNAISTEEGILAIGGYDRNGCLSSVERYDFSRNSWEPVGKMHTKRARFAAVRCTGVIYAIGGSNGQQELTSVESYNLKSLSWQRLISPMPTSRSCFGAAELDGKIYAVGGTHYSIPLQVAELFDPSTQQWKTIPPLQSARSDLAAASCNGKVYAIGGQRSGWKVLSDVECYDPSENAWKSVPSLNTPRRNAVAVTIEDNLYVIGGYDGSKALNTVEVYNPLTNKWIYSTPMYVKRSNATATVFDGSIYVIGGFSGSRFLNSVECYNPGNQQWTSFV